MFNRTSHFVANCVKCQRRLAASSRAWVPNNVSKPPVGRRWQSAVAIEVDEDDQVSYSTDPNTRGDAKPDSKPSAHEFDSPRPNAQNQPRNDTRYRRWQPHKAETLGMDVLGKPAEVLILPTRKRKIAQPVPADTETSEKSGLQESLDSELKPISMEDVLKNIDSLKTEMGGEREKFSTSEWKEHRKRLSDGFTKAQLQEYLRVAAGKSKSDPKESYMPANDQKRGMAAKIMNDVWKWSSREEGEAAAAVKASQPQPTEKTMVINAAKLDYIMLHEKQQLASISEKYDIQIDVFKKKSRIKLSGTPTAVETAHASLSQVVKSVQALSLHIPKSLHGLLRDNAKLNDLLSRLMQKHKLLIQKNRDALNVVGPTKTHIDVILRDMILLSGEDCESIPYSFFPDRLQGSAVKALFPSDDLPQWIQQDKTWYRHISSLARISDDTESSVPDVRQLQKLASNVLKSEKPDQTRISRFVTAPGSLTHEYIASIGQTLFGQTTTDSILDTKHREKQAKAESIFSLQPALLPQALARGSFTPVVDLGDHGAENEGLPSHPFLLHLRLRPVVETPIFPRFEMLLSGQNASLGLRQHLKIKQVHAILDEWQHSILLPHQTADILLSRQSKIDLIRTNNTQPSKAYLSILRQLGSYLEQARSSSQVELPPVWKIDVSPLLKNKAVELEGEEGDSLNAIIQNENSAEVKGQADPKSISTAKTISSYILEPPEYMDVNSYSSSITGDRYVDHIVCDTDPLERPRSSHVLRIAREPLVNLVCDKSMTQSDTGRVTHQHKWFKDSITAAFNLVTVLGDASNPASRPGQTFSVRS